MADFGSQASNNGVTYGLTLIDTKLIDTTILPPRVSDLAYSLRPTRPKELF
jgi:hypothetical protein